jgi:SOS-response transcriptional repressor LexA
MIDLIENMSEKGQVLLRYIKAYRETHHYGPTYSEIMNDLGWSTKSLVDYWIQQLERRGLIERVPNYPRSVKLTQLALEELS